MINLKNHESSQNPETKKLIEAFTNFTYQIKDRIEFLETDLDRLNAKDVELINHIKLSLIELKEATYTDNESLELSMAILDIYFLQLIKISNFLENQLQMEEAIKKLRVKTTPKYSDNEIEDLVNPISKQKLVASLELQLSKKVQLFKAINPNIEDLVGIPAYKVDSESPLDVQIETLQQAICLIQAKIDNSNPQAKSRRPFDSIIQKVKKIITPKNS